MPTKGIENPHNLRIATETEDHQQKRMSPSVKWGHIRSIVLLIPMHHGEGPYLL